MLRKISKPAVVNKMPQDIRHHSYGISRIVYVSIISILAFVFINYIFYSTYLLIGDGFVDSDSRTMALEYDAQIEDIYVENGDKVSKGQNLFIFDSMDFRSQVLKVITDYTGVVTRRQALDSDISRLNVVLGVTDGYLKSIEDALKNLEKLQKHGNTTVDRILTEKTREFSAFRDYEGYKALLDSNLSALSELQEIIYICETTLSYFLDTYTEGIKNAPMDGFVGNLNIQPGAVVRKTEPIMKVYYGKRYLSVLFEDSYVGKKEGDPVIVSFNDGTNHTIGRIVDIGNFTLELPDEIKPRYRPPGRRMMGRVLVDAALLDSQEILSAARIYKPVGMDLICKVTDCKPYLLDRYKEYLKERSDLQKQTKLERLEKNNYLVKMKERALLRQNLKNDKKS